MSYTLTVTATRTCTVKELLLKDAALSATIVKRAKYGGIRLRGETVTVRATVCAGETVTVTLADTPSVIPPIDRPLEVLYEDDDILAVVKERGMPMHPCRGNHLPTLANVVAAHREDIPIFRAIGRLDRDTSGVVLLAKHALAASRLGQAMKEGAIGREYVAVIDGTLTPPTGRVDAPIARESEGSMRRTVCEGGKRAITDYETLSVLDGTHSLVRLRLLTGRTHQIRVHMAYLGHPLTGDALYGEASEEGYRLHATALTFPHPRDGKPITVRSTPSWLS